MPRPCLSSLICSLILLVLNSLTFAQSEPVEHFENHIRPLLLKHCSECHSGATADANLDLTSKAGFAKGGMSGLMIEGNDASLSLLYSRISTADDDSVMPPDGRLSEDEIAAVKQWIEKGAVWPEHASIERNEETHWAFEPIQHPKPPEVTNDQWCWTPVDRFILAQQEARSLKPVSDASAQIWLRRVCLDLTGLPPTIEQQEAYAAVGYPKAQIIEDLLSSRAYAERQGRRWLDLARYADTSGDGTDTPIPEARYYRDYVIDAFENDMPYNQFLIEQLAGDLLAKENPDNPRAHEQLIATGFIALSRRFGNSRFAELHQIIDDTIDTVGKSTMGLTLGCARCHHHKFDPVTSEDYYGLYGYFASTQYPHAGTEHQKDRSHMPALHVPDNLKERYESDVAWAVSDHEKIADARIHRAGDPQSKGDLARRGFLDFLNDADLPVEITNSGRLELARWITAPDHPLTARVMANRIWMSHFGQGLVENPSNFGRQSLPPTHPELLDYLATELINSGWSIKHLHRLITFSHTYSLSSQENDAQLAIDEANTSLWHFPRQRMDAETLRDSMLAVSGQLEHGDGGRHPFKPTDKLKYSQGRPFDEIFDHNRRSVYLMTPRLKKHPMMALFDGTDANVTTAKRGESTVPLQSLFFVNGEFSTTLATHLGEQARTSNDHTDVQLTRLWKLVYSRAPEHWEISEATGYLQQYQQARLESGDTQQEAITASWTSLSRALLASNEFIYID